MVLSTDEKILMTITATYVRQIREARMQWLDTTEVLMVMTNIAVQTATLTSQQQQHCMTIRQQSIKMGIDDQRSLKHVHLEILEYREFQEVGIFVFSVAFLGFGYVLLQNRSKLVARVPDLVYGSHVHSEYMKILCLFLKAEDDFGGDGSSDNELAKMEEPSTSSSDEFSSSDDQVGTYTRFKIHLPDDRGIMKGERIKRSKKLNLLVSWSDQMMRHYDTCHLNSLPEIFRHGFPGSKFEELVSLYRCLEGFSKEEPLGPEYMWFCPSCKEHQPASKKLDLWRFSAILVVHLKRFSYSHFLKNKLETYVDFPMEKLELSGFLAHKNGSLSNCYIMETGGLSSMAALLKKLERTTSRHLRPTFFSTEDS